MFIKILLICILYVIPVIINGFTFIYEKITDDSANTIGELILCCIGIFCPIINFLILPQTNIGKKIWNVEKNKKR